MSFRIEIADITRMTLRSSASSVRSEESDEETVPFTTSPLDQCRGAIQPTPSVNYRRRRVRNASRQPHTQTQKGYGATR
jgi:hypothetical protein